MSSASLLSTILIPVLAIYLCASYANAQRFAPGYCPTITAQESFDKTRFFGNWIEVEKTPSIFDLMMRCLVVDYSDDQDNTVNVVVRGISLAGLPLTVNGDGLLQDVHRSGFYSIRYGFGVPFQGTLTTILDTDYDDYAVVYSCTNSLLSGVFHSEYIWVLSRSGKISNPTRQNIYEKLDKLQINRSGLTMSDRSTCPTNSSTVARESDKDLAVIGASPVQPASGTDTQASASSLSGQASSSDSASASSSSSSSSSSVEPTQKSVVVPLLYDPPTQQVQPKQSALKQAASDAKAAAQAKQQQQQQLAQGAQVAPISSANSQQQQVQLVKQTALPGQQQLAVPITTNGASQSLPASAQSSPSSSVSSVVASNSAPVGIGRVQSQQPQQAAAISRGAIAGSLSS